MSMNISQTQLISDILEVLSDKHGVKELNNRHINAVCQAATDITHALNIPHKPSVPSSGLAAWLNCDETGRSSMFMAAVCEPRMVPGFPGHIRDRFHPLDPSDFGRCYGLLEAEPSIRSKFNEIKEAGGPVWTVLIDNWAELETLYLEERKQESAPKLYSRMQELISEAESLL